MKFSKITLLFALFIILSTAVMRQALNFLYQNLGAKRLELLVGVIFLLSGLIFFSKMGVSYNLKTVLNPSVPQDGELAEPFMYHWDGFFSSLANQNY